jgi:hypothetical protein
MLEVKAVSERPPSGDLCILLLSLENSEEKLSVVLVVHASHHFVFVSHSVSAVALLHSCGDVRLAPDF